MKPARRAAFLAKLTALQRELSEHGRAMIEPNRTSEAEIGDNDDEQPLNEMLQSVASGRNRNHAQMAILIGKSLAKLRDDPEDYGVCEDCGEDIPAARLEAMPYAAFCVACQAKVDGPKSGPTRRKLTDYR